MYPLIQGLARNTNDFQDFLGPEFGTPKFRNPFRIFKDRGKPAKDTIVHRLVDLEYYRIHERFAASHARLYSL